MPSNRSSAQSGGIAGQIPLLAVMMLGLFVAILNQTLLNVAIPHLITEFGVTASTAQWLLTGYMLVNGALIPISAFLIERFGVRRLFLLAMLFFSVGSLVCGLAPTFSVLLIGRLIQAVGGGVLMPLVMTTIMFIFPPEMRGKGMGIFGLAMMFAPAVGPTLSGWIIEHYTWRLLFNGMVPLGFIVLVVAFFVLRDTIETKNIRLDIFGTLTSSIGVALILYGLSESGSKGWDSAVVIGTLVIGVILTFIFVIQQMRSERPMLDFRVFRYDMFSVSNIINVILTVAMYAGMFLLPIYLQNLRGYTALQSGLLMLPGAIIMGAMSPVSGILFDKIGPRPLAIVGLLITVVTTYEFTHLDLNTSYNHILLIYMIRAFGMSLLMMPIMTAGMNQLPQHMNSHGTAMSNTIRQIAGSLGISIFTTIFSNRTTFHVGKMSEHMNMLDPTFSQSFHSLTQSVAGSTGMPAAQAQQTAASLLAGQMSQQATVMGINDAFFWATIVTIVGLVLSFFLRDVRKDTQIELGSERKLRMLEQGEPVVKRI
jgi:EmrB/QacA subfamily drug resistance transporter